MPIDCSIGPYVPIEKEMTPNKQQSEGRNSVSKTTWSLWLRSMCMCVCVSVGCTNLKLNTCERKTKGSTNTRTHSRNYGTWFSFVFTMRHQNRMVLSCINRCLSNRFSCITPSPASIQLSHIKCGIHITTPVKTVYNTFSVPFPLSLKSTFS